MNMIQKAASWIFGIENTPTQSKTISVYDLPNYQSVYRGNGGYGGSEAWTGEKFAGGLGETPGEIWNDYYTQRQWSNKIFKQNLYGKGLIRRLVTNEIHTGLSLECVPDELTLGLEEDSLQDWSDSVERKWELWGRAKNVCDYNHTDVFSKISETARREALIEGDVLVVLRVDQKTRQRSVQLVSGSSVCNPYTMDGERKLPAGHTLKYGVQRDAKGRHVAYWVRNEDGKYSKIDAIGKNSGRPMAWLVYGSGDRRVGEVRGEPLLTVILQSLKEIDKYRDSMQRKAVVNSLLAMFYEKGDDRPGTGGLANAAIKRTTVEGSGYATSESSSTTQFRNFIVDSVLPGVVHSELAKGEKPHVHSSAGAELPFGEFESAVIRAIAWCNQVPPEILELCFNSNYSASQAALSEFNMYLHWIRPSFAAQFNQPIYEQWLITEALLRKIDGQGLIDAWRNHADYETYQAWVRTEWYGSVKPSTDPVKTAKGYKAQVDECWTTNARVTRAVSGSNFERNTKRVAKENQMKADAAVPLAEFKQKYGRSVDDVMQNGANSIDFNSTLNAFGEDLLSKVEDLIESKLEDM